MKFDAKQIELAQSCTTAEELVSKAEDSGLSLSIKQAQSLLDAMEFTELSEDDFMSISGGVCSTQAANSPVCCICGCFENLFSYNGKCYCNPCFQEHFDEIKNSCK